MNIHELFADWVKREVGHLKRQKIGREDTRAKRTYIHFDKRRHPSSLYAYKSILLNPDKIAKNTFWPFIKNTIEVTRIKNKNDSRRRKDSKKRAVYYASHQDALIYSWYSFLLNEVYYTKKINELGIQECAIAYRKIPVGNGSKKNKCNIHFAKEVFDYIKNRGKDSVVFVSDITGFFDNLDHKHLKNEWLSVLGLDKEDQLPIDHNRIYENLTRFKYVEAKTIYEKFSVKLKRNVIRDRNGKYKIFKIPSRDGKAIRSILDHPYSRKDFTNLIVKARLIRGNENTNNKYEVSGIMQGSPISATLSNIYMMSFDKAVNDAVMKLGGLYKRYSDDLVIVCDPSDYQVMGSVVAEEIKKYGLEINHNKTDVTYFRKKNEKLKGFNGKNTNKHMQYLGFNFDGNATYIRSPSLAKYYRRMKSVVRKNISMAYGKESKTKNEGNKIFKKSLYKRFLYPGRRSFITYALRANKMMGQDSIKRQLRNRTSIMQSYLNRKQRIRYWMKKNDGTKSRLF